MFTFNEAYRLTRRWTLLTPLVHDFHLVAGQNATQFEWQKAQTCAVYGK